MISDTI